MNWTKLAVLNCLKYSWMAEWVICIEPNWLCHQLQEMIIPASVC